MSEAPERNEAAPPTAVAARRERLLARLGGGSLRNHTAGGVLVNGAWSIGLQGLGFLRGFLVAAFLAPHDYGVWAIIVVGYSMLGVLRQVGIGEKYVQQDDPDEATAFQKAFTLEAILSGGMWLVLMVFTPVIALIYRAPEIIAPGLIALLAMPGAILQTPVWAYHRRMDFRSERRLTAIDPVVAMIVTVALAIAGFGYWSFAIGNVVGTWAGAIVVVRHAPYPLRFRYERGTARSYVQFSTPLLLSNLSSIVLVQGTTLFARSAVGIAGVGALALANSVRTYTAFADGIISASMYPAICAMKDRRAVLHESFVKSNRLALMWGFPVGVGVAVFAGDVIHFLLGDRWHFAIPLFAAVGVVSAIGHIAFNWDDYVRAIGNTRPVAVYGWIGLIGCCSTGCAATASACSWSRCSTSARGPTTCSASSRASRSGVTRCARSRRPSRRSPSCSACGCSSPRGAAWRSSPARSSSTSPSPPRRRGSPSAPCCARRSATCAAPAGSDRRRPDPHGRVREALVARHELLAPERGPQLARDRAP
jgi:O-antigen/teichoic acid export membrane protein